ncbi:uncharacterized protein BDZ99DRAFT_41301 [Mytilinidion resinicola]|uniref:Uncharacterized protein n=1 Tax=Mytilinidion resinicola TaxID=574789 RepID=A0A6A6YJY9_9PEZI|nr:uncharacterized protein BDZ99DRAFT_41301 [Mytilinidion resinicola]KAF2808869.1 hypothetical protein BDZ99DRAFT_41301 [Mytilinidion resinicola]
MLYNRDEAGKTLEGLRRLQPCLAKESTVRTKCELPRRTEIISGRINCGLATILPSVVGCHVTMITLSLCPALSPRITMFSASIPTQPAAAVAFMKV